MVNYCCVYGCGRNSRLNKHLNYYSVPKERERQVQWLKAAGREDLLDKDQGKLTVSHRFCSRHFTPSSIKNRHLCVDAVPTLCLPGSNWSDAESEDDPQPHSGVACDSCGSRIVGFRYKCVCCPDYDLCQKCEMLEVHSHHYMIRIPKPMKFKQTDNLLKKMRHFIKSENIGLDFEDTKRKTALDSESSDDEPITKYAKNYDSGVDLSEDIKNKIRKEVTRALKSTEKKKIKSKKRAADGASKKINTVDCSIQERKTAIPEAPEVVFADVNEVKEGSDVKTAYSNELMPAVGATSQNLEESQQQPVMHVKLSDDLSELMIEVTSNNQKTFYKY